MTKVDDHFQQVMNEGHSSAWEQRWDQAADFYREAVELSPNDLGAITSLGLALFELQDYQEALHYYMLAARLSFSDPLPFEKLAQLYDRLGDPGQSVRAALQAAELYLKNHDVDKAIENWNRVLALKPENLQAHSRLAIVYERMRKEKQAVLEYINIASIFQQSNELERAFRTIQHAVQVFPDNDAARQALDLLKQGRRLPKPVRPPIHTSRQPSAQERRGWESQGTVSELRVSQEPGLDPVAEARQKALAVLAGMLFDSPDAEPTGGSARRAQQGFGLRAAVLPSFVRSVGERLPKQADPGRVLTHLSQLVELHSSGDDDLAIRELEQAVEAGLHHEAAYFDLGLLYAKAGKPEAALHPLQHALMHPDYGLGCRLLLGEALSKLERWNEAAVEFLEALRLADTALIPPDQAEALDGRYEPIIEAQRQLNDPIGEQRLCGMISDLLLRPAWREHLSQARQELPIQGTGGNPVPIAEILTQARSSQIVELLSRVNQLTEAGLLQSAMEEAYYTLQFAPTYLPLHAYMGDLLLKQNRLPEAVAKMVVVARTYSIRGDCRRAIDLYRKVIKLAPLDIEAHNLLIDQLEAVGQLDEAIQAYLDLAEVHYDLADMNGVRKAFAEALHLAQEPGADRSWRVKILYRMADHDLQRLDLRQALRTFEQIRMLEPDDEKVRVKLAELNFRLGQESMALSEVDNYVAYLGSKGQKEKAASFLESLIQENLSVPSLFRRLAEVYVQIGRIPDALSQLDAAGEAYLLAGDRAGAVGAVEAILKLKPENAAAYQKLLGQLRGR